MAGGSLADDGRSQELAALVEHALLDHLVRPQQQGLRDCEAEGLGGLKVDHQLELRRLFDRQVRGLGALEDFVDVGGGTAEQIWNVRTVGYEPPTSTLSRSLYMVGNRLLTANSTTSFRRALRRGFHTA